MLAIPLGDADVAFRVFDSNNSGKVDLKEFMQVVDGICSKYIPVGRYSRKEELFPRLVEALFGEGDSVGKRTMDIPRFSKFLEQLKDQVTLAEYSRLCDKEGRIGLREAALLLVGSATPAQVERLGRKAMELPGLGCSANA